MSSQCPFQLDCLALPSSSMAMCMCQVYDHDPHTSKSCDPCLSQPTTTAPLFACRGAPTQIACAMMEA